MDHHQTLNSEDLKLQRTDAYIPVDTKSDMKASPDIEILDFDMIGKQEMKFLENNDQDQEVEADSSIFYLPDHCKFVERLETDFQTFWKAHRCMFIRVCKVVLLLLFLSVYGYSLYCRSMDEGNVVLTIILAAIIINVVNERFCTPSEEIRRRLGCYNWYLVSKNANRTGRVVRILFYIVALVGFGVYLGIDVLSKRPQNAQAFLGIAALIIFCFIFSHRPSKVNWHPVYWGFIAQIGFALFTLRTTVGYKAFHWIGNMVHIFVRLSDNGSKFVFGESFTATNAGFFFDSAGVIVFFNSCIFMVDYFGGLEFIVLKIGRFLAFCLETGPVESVVAAANIFIGLSEAPLLVRPYLPTVTKSELHSIMTCGFASISGSFMAMFIQAGASPTHLLTAAVISAPAALAITKLMYPETEKVDFASQRNIRMRSEEDAQANCLQAYSDGSSFSVKLVASIMVNMVAFVSLLNLIDVLLIWIGYRVGVDNMNFEYVSSYVFYPVAYGMGSQASDCGKVGALLGLKMLATPFVAYKDLGLMIENRHALEEYVATSNGTWHWDNNNVILDATNTTLIKGVMSERAEVITTYAMCGLSAFPAIGFSLGTLIPMCPKRKPDIVKLVISAFIAGNLANLATGAVAGIMFVETSTGVV